MTEKCFTIGYQGRALDELCEVLCEAGVDLLVDIRERAWSYRPGYRKRMLQGALGEVGIEYLHLKAAGNPFRPQNGDERGFQECARQYRIHLRRNPDVVAEVRRLISEESVVFFCYESEAEECHRSVLIDEVRRENPQLSVTHL